MTVLNHLDEWLYLLVWMIQHFGYENLGVIVPVPHVTALGQR